MNSSEYGKKIRHKAVPAVYLLLITGMEILLTLRRNTGYQDGSWNVPSGHVEPGELPMEALIREVKEEIGIVLSPRNLTLVHTSYRPQHDETGDRVDLFFRAGMWWGQETNAEPEKCAEVRWFDAYDLPPNTTPHVRHAIVEMQRGSRYSELGLEWIKEQGLYKLG